jgi:hypothetical protein
MKSLNSRFFCVLTVLTFSCFSLSAFAAPPPKCEPWPQCKGGDDGGGETSAEYTAALTAGGFRFGPVDVTTNNRGTGYSSTLKLDMSRTPDGTTDADAWDDVFLACYEVLGGTQISGVTVGTDWGISQGGKNSVATAKNVRITFRSVVADEFQDVDLWFALINWTPGNPRSDFLPAPGEKSIYTLDTAKIFGDDIDNHTSCNSGEFPLSSHTQLEICHKYQNGDGCG